MIGREGVAITRLPLAIPVVPLQLRWVRDPVLLDFVERRDISLLYTELATTIKKPSF
jgi:hypothetical protein